MNKWIAASLVALTAVAIGLGGCSSQTVVESDMRIKGAPDWVNEGTNVLKTRDGRLFHGLGSAPVMGDESLQVSTADDRARAEVARALTSYMDVVTKDYLASAQTAQGAVVDQSVSRSIENVTKINLAGARIIAHWKQKKTNVVYALAEIDMKAVKETMEKVEAMTPGFKTHFNEKADSLFDSMAKESVK